MRTIQVTVTAKELREYRDRGALLLWSKKDDEEPYFWAPAEKRSSAHVWYRGEVVSQILGDWQDFLTASDHDTVDDVPDDEVITATIKIPDAIRGPNIVVHEEPAKTIKATFVLAESPEKRGPGRPRTRTEPLERSAIDLPVSLWNELDAAKGSDSRRAYIEAAIRDKIERDKVDEHAAEELRQAQERDVYKDRQHLYSQVEPSNTRERERKG